MYKLFEENGFEVCGVIILFGSILDIDMGMEMGDFNFYGEGSFF